MPGNKDLDDLLKVMTESQQAMFRKLTAARTTPSAGSPRKAASPNLTGDELTKLKLEAEKFKAAQRNVASQLGVLWSAQLDKATLTGDIEAMRRAILDQRAYQDNCNCGPPP